jgi:GTP-binding protein EngB required for normal cell division
VTSARKVELEALLGRLARVAAEAAADTAQDEAEDLRQKLAADRFEMVVMGQFKRGKSSLINVLLGRDVLPTGTVPLTSVMTVVRHGPAPRLRVFLKKKPAVEAGLEHLPAYITEKGNPRNEKGVLRVEVEVDSPFLADGDVLVDTPGVGSVHAHNTQAAYDSIPRADAVLYVLSVDPPVGEEDLKFLMSLRPYVAKVFFVLNKRDYLAPEQFDENRRFTEEALRAALQVESVPLFAFSARWAAEARTNGDAALLERSGQPALERHLREFLREAKERDVLHRTARRAEAAAQVALAMVDMEHRAYLSDSLDLEKRAWALSSYVNNVFMEAARAKRRLKAGFEAYRKLVRKAAAAFCRTAAREVAREASRSAQGSARASAPELRSRLERLHRAQAKQALDRWFAERETWMAHGYEKLRQEFEGRVLLQLDGVWKAAEGLFDLSGGAELPAPARPRWPEVYVQNLDFGLPAALARGLAKGARGAEKAAAARAERVLRQGAGPVVEGLLSALADDLAACAAALDRLARESQVLADRAVKVVVDRQTANESAVADRLAALRRRLTEAQGLKNDLAVFAAATRPAPVPAP